ncbi:hypothetical protein SVAN01_08659, partial [Stagonosporopsis vannaccii]
EEAFQDAKAKFALDLTKDPRKISYARSAARLEDVKVVVEQAVERYNASRSDKKSRKWLVKLSRWIHHYSGVFDVFAQHHPEYVALAWGSMKFLLMAVINHEDVITTLAKAIAEIAWSLPRVQLYTELYPTDRMKTAVTNLYACILQFLIRAREWYEQGRLKRFVHSITSPVELRYQDLLDEIANNSLLVEKLADSGSRAELRDLHEEVLKLRKENQNMHHQSTDSFQKIQLMLTMIEKLQMTSPCERNLWLWLECRMLTYAATSIVVIDTNHPITEVQFRISLSALPTIPMLEPNKSYQYHRTLQRQRFRAPNTYAIPNSFWRSQILQAWSSTSSSAVCVIAGGFQARFALRDLCVGIIGQLYDADMPVLFALKVLQPDDSTTEKLTTTDILKSLSRQALELQKKSQTEKSMAANLAKFQQATTGEDWFGVLEALLTSFETPVYIVIDLGLLSNQPSEDRGFLWTRSFERFFAILSGRKPSSQVKVLLVGYGTLPFQMTEQERATLLVTLKTQLVTARQRKAVRGPRSQQKELKLNGVQALESKSKLPRR